MQWGSQEISYFPKGKCAVMGKGTGNIWGANKIHLLTWVGATEVHSLVKRIHWASFLFCILCCLCDILQYKKLNKFTESYLFGIYFLLIYSIQSSYCFLRKIWSVSYSFMISKNSDSRLPLVVSLYCNKISKLFKLKNELMIKYL